MVEPCLQTPSPNRSARSAGAGIDTIVLHADAGRTEAGTVSWLTSPTSKASYHYLVGRDGRVYQFVPEPLKAWHAGVSSFRGRTNLNNTSIGVSFANNMAGEEYRAKALKEGVILVASIMRRYGIPLDRVVTHSYVSPGRKIDPGPKFPLERFLADVQKRLDEQPPQVRPVYGP